MTPCVYIEYNDLLEKHRKVILESDNTEDPGVRHPEAVKSILNFIQDDSFYPLFEDKITHLVFSIATRQDFLAANKRTAIIAGAYFLELNSYSQAIVGNFIQYMENPVLWVATHQVDKTILRHIIHDLINDLEISEHTKLLIATYQ